MCARWKWLAAAVVLVLAAPARAQLGSEIPIDRRTFDRFVEILALDQTQSEAALSVFEVYLEEHREASEDVQKQAEAIQEEIERGGLAFGPEVQRKHATLQIRFRERTAELEQQFFEDLKLFATDEQLREWKRIERLRRRQVLMRGEIGQAVSALAGAAGVDIYILAQDQGLLDGPHAGTVDTVLERYEREIDGQLVKTFDLIKEVMEMQERVMRGEMEMGLAALEESLGVFDRILEQLLEMGDVNQRYARQIETALPEELVVGFHTEMRARSFPQIYQYNLITPMLDTAAGLDDLTQEQQSRLGRIDAEYRDALEKVNERWMQATIKGQRQDDLMQKMMMMGKLDFDDQRERDERQELDEKTYDALETLLTEAQLERLPEPPKEGFVPKSFD